MYLCCVDVPKCACFIDIEDVPLCLDDFKVSYLFIFVVFCGATSGPSGLRVFIKCRPIALMHIVMPHEAYTYTRHSTFLSGRSEFNRRGEFLPPRHVAFNILDELCSAAKAVV